MAEALENEESAGAQPQRYQLKPDPQSMRKLALGSALTVSVLIIMPDGVGLMPLTPDIVNWVMRMLGLWLSAFIQWLVGFLALLHLARFAGGGMTFDAEGVRFWRFGKRVAWADVKAVTVEVQPLFSRAFWLKPVSRRLIIYEERKPSSSKSKGGQDQKTPVMKLVPHPVPSFQFSLSQFTSLFAYACKSALGFVPHSLDCFAFVPDAADYLRQTSRKAAIMRVILSIVIAFGLVSFLGRKSAIDYYYNLGTSHFRHAQYKEAARQYQVATKIDPTFAAAWDQLARSEFRAGNVDDAEKHWHKALDMKPDLVEAKLGLTNIYLRRGQLVEAGQLLEKCARLAPHNNAVYLNQAELYTRLGQGDKARQVLDVVAKESSRNAEALVKAGKIYSELGDMGKAKELAESALELDPGNASARALLKLAGDKR